LAFFCKFFYEGILVNLTSEKEKSKKIFTFLLGWLNHVYLLLFTPHPSPLSQGERELEPSSI